MRGGSFHQITMPYTEWMYIYIYVNIYVIYMYINIYPDVRHGSCIGQFFLGESLSVQVVYIYVYNFMYICIYCVVYICIQHLYINHDAPNDVRSMYYVSVLFTYEFVTR